MSSLAPPPPSSPQSSIDDDKKSRRFAMKVGLGDISQSFDSQSGGGWSKGMLVATHQGIVFFIYIDIIDI